MTMVCSHYFYCVLAWSFHRLFDGPYTAGEIWCFSQWVWLDDLPVGRESYWTQGFGGLYWLYLRIQSPKMISMLGKSQEFYTEFRCLKHAEGSWEAYHLFIEILNSPVAMHTTQIFRMWPTLRNKRCELSNLETSRCLVYLVVCCCCCCCCCCCGCGCCCCCCCCCCAASVRCADYMCVYIYIYVHIYPET